MKGMKNFRGVVLASSMLVLVAAGCKKETPAPESPSNATTQPVAKSPVATIPKSHIYDETADPKKDIAVALKQAKAEHKNVILDFGGDWCGDCQVLYYYFHKSPNVEVLQKNFVLVPIWVGRHIELNRELAASYGVPLEKGVPALAVLDGKSGKVLYAQHGEFSNMRNMDEKYATDFLDRWKP